MPASLLRAARRSLGVGAALLALAGLWELYRTDLATKAVAELKAQGLDVNGKSWKPLNVKVSPGGK